MTDDTIITPVPTPPVIPAPRTFAQDEVSSLLAKEKDQAQRSYRDNLLKELGVANVKDLETRLKEADELKQAQMSEAEKAKAAADVERTAAVQERAAAQAERLASQVERALIRAGLPVEVPSADGKSKVENPALPYALRLVDVPVGADSAAVQAAVDGVKATFPQIFTTAAPPAVSAGSTATGRPPRTPSSTTMSSSEMAALARKKFRAGS